MKVEDPLRFHHGKNIIRALVSSRARFKRATTLSSGQKERL
jgi:hypothetical protein